MGSERSRVFTARLATTSSSAGSTTITATPTPTAFRLHAVFVPGTSFVGNVAMVLVLLVGGYRVTDGSLDLGVLTAFLLYVRQFFDPMEDVAVFYNSLQSATAALEKISAVLAEPPVSVPEPTAITDRVERARPRRGVELHERRVRLPPRSGRSCTSSSLMIPAGQTVALVGRDRCRQIDDRQADRALL